MAACKKLGINVKTNCKKGDCGTCTVNIGGKSMRACIGKVPPAPKLKSIGRSAKAPRQTPPLEEPAKKC